METIGVLEARRLALVRAGLLKPEWIGLPRRATGRGARARAAAHHVIRHFGYLQLDTVTIAGARSHAIVLLSRLDGFDPTLAEELLRPKQPIFEYWGHEASWLPIELYPVFEFRRKAFLQHPWWSDIVGQHPKVADALRHRIRHEGPLRSLDMEGRGSRGWWDLKVARRVASALWSSGELAIRERRNFQKTYDLVERVIPDHWRDRSVPKQEAIEQLILRALGGHGWATTGTLSQTWRLNNRDRTINRALHNLCDDSSVVPCTLVHDDRRRSPGWIQPADLELAERLTRVRPRSDRGVLLSPFDPMLWDRRRVQRLFRFDQILEIYKPRSKRVYGYFCLPVLAGDRLVARLDLKADRKAKTLRVLVQKFEQTDGSRAVTIRDREAARSALDRYANALELKVQGWKHR